MELMLENMILSRAIGNPEELEKIIKRHSIEDFENIENKIIFEIISELFTYDFEIDHQILMSYLIANYGKESQKLFCHFIDLDLLKFKE